MRRAVTILTVLLTGALAPGAARAQDPMDPDAPKIAREGVTALVQDLTEPRRPQCLELEGGVAGFAGGRETGEQNVIRGLTPDRGNGLAPGDPGNAPAGLPAQIHFKTPTESFNRRYQFLTRGGRLYFKSNTERTGIVQAWKELSLPRCFAGDVHEISLDDDELIATDSARRVYTMDGALGDPLLFTWTERWGAPLWQGPGWQIPAESTLWAWSVLSIPEDGTYKDGGGNDHPVGEAKVSHIWRLSDGGRRLNFNDPWLPRDSSYALCGPHRNRFRAVNLATSGSTIFLIGRRGDLFTRLFDFDQGGYDPFFEDYSYEDQRGKQNPAVQLPSPPWIRQPKVPGRITDRITIEKVGPATVHRTLRIEGWNAQGQTGYWEKDVSEPAWHFVVTGDPIGGHELANPRKDTSARGLAPSQDRRYVRAGEDWSGELPDFNWLCPPSRLRVTPSGGRPFTLLVRVLDTIRQLPRAEGLDDTPRELKGVVEVPKALLDGLASRDAATRDFITGTLQGKRFTEITLDATLRELSVRELGWRFAYAPAARR